MIISIKTGQQTQPFDYLERSDLWYVLKIDTAVRDQMSGKGTPLNNGRAEAPVFVYPHSNSYTLGAVAKSIKEEEICTTNHYLC